MKVGNSKDAFEKEISLKDEASDMEGMVPYQENNKFSWIQECKKGKKGDCKPILKFVNTVQEGIYKDVKQGHKKGEKSPPEFWARVWDEIHSSGRGPPENLPTKALKVKWNEMQTSGKAADEIWEHMEREYPGPFLLVPLVTRWHHMGQGKPDENVNMSDCLDDFNYIMLMIEDSQDMVQLRDKLHKMKEEEKKAEFWEEHWDDIHGIKRIKAICEDKHSGRRHKSNSGDVEKYIFPKRHNDETGKEIKLAPGYQQNYPFGYSFYKRLRKPADERPIYKEFDFCS